MLFRTNGQSETYEQALADAGVPYVLRGGERFFDRPEVREARLLLRGAARSADADDLPSTVRGRAVRRRLDASTPPEGGGAVRERWESLAALARLADDLAAAERRRDAARLRRRARRAGRRPARPDRRGRHARVAARRQGPGVGRRVPRRRSPRACCRSPTPRPPSRSRRSAGCSTSASPGPASTWRSPGRWPGHRAAAPARRPSRFLDGMHASSAQPPVGPRGRAGRKGPATCRVCGKALTAPVARKLGAARTARRRYDEELFERLREWRAEQAREASVPAYVVFTDATLTALAEVRPTTERGAARHLRHRPDQAGAVRRRRAGPLRGRPVAAGGTEDDDSGKSATAVKKMIAPDGDLP